MVTKIFGLDHAPGVFFHSHFPEEIGVTVRIPCPDGLYDVIKKMGLL
jgi:hypothetical protein